MKKIILPFLFLFPALLLAQEISQSVIGSAGDFNEGTNGSISWTIGETVIETVEGTNATLTQGFHQPQLTVVSFIENTELASSLQLFPNPVESILTIKADKTGKEYQVVNLSGQVVDNGNIDSNELQIDFSGFANGVYILKIDNIESFKIVKQ